MSLKYFDINVFNGSTLSDFESIKQALAILFSTHRGSLSFNRALGINLEEYLFDYGNEVTRTLLQSEVNYVLSKFFIHSDVLFDVNVDYKDLRGFEITVSFDYFGIKDSFVHYISTKD